jgi:hypothetical protein
MKTTKERKNEPDPMDAEARHVITGSVSGGTTRFCAPCFSAPQPFIGIHFPDGIVKA